VHLLCGRYPAVEGFNIVSPSQGATDVRTAALEKQAIENTVTVAPSEVHVPGSYYDGTPYSLVFDPMLRGLHQRVAAWVPEGVSCLDVCCGPGGLTFQLAQRCERVVGVYQSEKMIARAHELRRRSEHGPIEFRVGDAAQLDDFRAGAFDVATVAMGLH